MSRNSSPAASTTQVTPLRRPGPCDTLVVGLVLWTLCHAGDALAGDVTVPPVADAPSRITFPSEFSERRELSPLPAILVPVPSPFLPKPPEDSVPAATREFGSRPALPSGENRAGSAGESMMKDTTVWQRLSEYRTRDRVRLVTLWETGGNSLSLQAGRKGDPTLQWTSRLANHAAARGILDELFSTSIGGVVGRGLHLTPRAPIADGVGKPSRIFDERSLGLGAGTPH